MITPRIKPSGFFPPDPPDDRSVRQQRQAKLEGYVQTLAAMDELIDFAAMAAAVDTACPRPDRSKGGRPPYPTEVLVRMWSSCRGCTTCRTNSASTRCSTGLRIPPDPGRRSALKADSIPQ